MGNKKPAPSETGFVSHSLFFILYFLFFKLPAATTSVHHPHRPFLSSLQ